MNLQQRTLASLRVYENNPRNNNEAVSKVKESITRYGYKVPIVIDNNNVIVAGHTRFAALLQIHEETGQYGSIQVVIADDLTDNQLKQFRIVDNQVAALADWDFTALQIELASIDDFLLADFGDIKGFDTELHLVSDIVTEPDTVQSNMVKISIGGDKIELTEAEYHIWVSYIIGQKGMSLMEFVRLALEIDPVNRRYDNPRTI